jgi:leucyl-tRNA synthetase
MRPSGSKRETNTMPQWAGSCWYYLRYIDPHNASAAWSADAERRWMGPAGVDLYVGGAEHAVLHLLYSRFWHKVLFDLGWVSSKEPFHKLRHQGMILSYSYQDRLGAYHAYEEVDFTKTPPVLKATGEELKELKEKMSKSKKNVISPDEVIDRHGADAMRLYEMFMGDFEAEKPWDMRTVEGVVRFLHKVWRLGESPRVSKEQNERIRHRTVHAVTERIEHFKFNTALAALMEYLNALSSGAAEEDLWAMAELLSRLRRIWRKRWGNGWAGLGSFPAARGRRRTPLWWPKILWNIPYKSTAVSKIGCPFPSGLRPPRFCLRPRPCPACERR